MLFRSHSYETVMGSIKSREADSKLHIDPQSEHADWIIEFFSDEPLNLEEALVRKDLKLGVRFTLWNDAPVSDLLRALEAAECNIKFDKDSGQIDRTLIEITGNPSASQIESVADQLFPELRQITRGRRKPEWHSGMDGIAQLTAVSLLGGRMFQEWN